MSGVTIVARSEPAVQGVEVLQKKKFNGLEISV